MATGKECLNRHFISLFLLIFMGYFYNGECLLCYQCSDSATGGDCQTDIEGMQEEFIKEIYLFNASSTLQNTSQYTYIQWCPEDYCTVQDISQSGDTIGYIRGCSSGMKSKPDAGYTVENIQANNKTICGISMNGNGMLACVSFCQKDLCNGPQADQRPVNSGNALINKVFILEKTVLLIVFAFVLSSKTFI